MSAAWETPPLKSRPQREIRESFKRGWHDSAPSWAASDGETALRAHRARGTTVCTMAWGAGRSATGGTRRGSQALRLRCFVRCRLACGRSAASAPAPALPRAWGADASRDADLCCLRSRRVLRRRKASPLFKLWSSEPLVKISHSCQCGALVQRAWHVIHLQPAESLQKTTESSLTSCARLRVARPLIYEV